MALPEALLLAWGLAGGARRGAATALFAAFLLLTIAGDLVIFSEVSGELLTGAGNQHVRGIGAAGLSELSAAFFHSRPAGAAWAAATFAATSWLLGILVLAARARSGATEGGSRN
jgi:hypothetical protein